MIALAFESTTNKLIKVYDADMKFQYAYSFNEPGTYGIEWDSQNVLICFVRGDYIVSVDPYGNIVELKRIKDTDNNDSNWYRNIFATGKKVDKEIYRLSNVGLLRFFGGSYSQLVKTDADGIETILYNENDQQLLNIVFAIIFILIFTAIVVFPIIKYIKNAREQYSKS